MPSGDGEAVSCPNCGQPARGRFCTMCGARTQNTSHLVRTGDYGARFSSGIALPPVQRVVDGAATVVVRTTDARARDSIGESAKTQVLSIADLQRLGLGTRPDSIGAKRETPHFRILYRPGSLAEQNLSLIESRLETSYAAFSDLLGVDTHGAIIDVSLSEAAGPNEHPSYTVPSRMHIYDVFSEDAPAEGLERSLLLLIMALALDTEAQPPPLATDGVLALAMQRTGAFPPDDQLISALAGARAAGQLPAIQTLLSGATPATRGVYFAAAASLVGYLLRTHGPGAFLRFIDALTGGSVDDAAQTVYKQSLQRLERSWHKTLKVSASGGVWRFVVLTSGYLSSYKLKCAEIVFYLCLAVAFGIGMAKMQGLLLDKALIPGDKHALAVILGVLVAAFAIVSLASLRLSYVTAYVSESMMKNMRLRMFSLVQRLHPGFFQTMESGDIMSRMSSDLAAVQFALTGSMVQGLHLSLMLVAASVTIFVTDWKLSLVAMAGTPLFFITTRYLGPAAAGASRTRQQNLATVTSDIQENLSAQQVIKAFGLETHATQRFTSYLDMLFQSSLRLTYLSGIYALSANTVATGINLVILGVGAYLVIGHQLTTGTLFAFLALMGQIIGPIQGLSGILQGLQQATGAMDRVDELMKAEPAIVDAKEARPAPRLSRAIRVENVFFGYQPNEPILRNIDLTIRAGESVAFVGPSGCGKSTLLNLIMRFYDPQGGRVCFDGMDLREATLQSVRGQMAVVFQDNILFNTSIRENLRLGNIDATDAEVEAAARAAEIHELIMSLPQGYDTEVGERGGRLSGGQRQRLAIARALIRNPSILILDEATSALDPRTEAAINETLARIGRGKTTISVTHRLASVVTADRVFVLDAGRLVEQGSHDELLRRGGLYAELWKEQGGSLDGAQSPAGVEVSQLGGIPLFAPLDRETLSSVARLLVTLEYSTGETIIHKGDPGDRMFIVHRGQVEVRSSDPATGPQALALLREGAYFGEMALISDAPRNATVVARTPVELYSLKKETFLGLLSVVPAMRDIVQTVARQRARKLSSR